MKLLSDYVSSPSIVPLAFAVALLVALFGVRAFIHSLDRSRIAECIQRWHGTLIKVAQISDLLEWFFTKGKIRRYQVIYRTKDGETVTTSCVASFWTGLHWADDAWVVISRVLPAL